MLNYRCRKIFIFYTLMVPCTSDSYVLTPSKSVDISRCSSHDILSCYQYIRKLSSSEALPSYCIHCYGNFISAFYDLTFASKWFINISTNSFKILLGSSLKIGSLGGDQFWSFFSSCPTRGNCEWRGAQNNLSDIPIQTCVCGGPEQAFRYLDFDFCLFQSCDCPLPGWLHTNPR